MQIEEVIKTLLRYFLNDVNGCMQGSNDFNDVNDVIDFYAQIIVKRFIKHQKEAQK